MTEPGSAGVPPAGDGAHRPRRAPIRILAILFAAFAIVILGIIAAAWYVAHRIEQMAVHAVTRKEESLDLGTLVTRVRELNRLETAGMRVVSVSTISQTYDLLPNAL